MVREVRQRFLHGECAVSQDDVSRKALRELDTAGICSIEQVRPWFHGSQPLGFTAEARFDESVTAEGAVERVLAAIGR